MEDVLSLLKSVSTLSKQSRAYKYVTTGSYALNYVISGKMDGGVPVPGITQFIGDSSTGKSAFATAILGNAQRLGYYTLYEDAENTLSAEFARILGLDPEVMAYNNPGTIEDAFEHMELVVKEIRQHDKDTPIVIVLDSLPVLDVREEALADPASAQPVRLTDGGGERFVSHAGVLDQGNLERPDPIPLIWIEGKFHPLEVDPTIQLESNPTRPKSLPRR